MSYTYSMHNPTMIFRTSVKDNEEQVKIVTGGYPESTVFKGSMDTFREQTGVIIFDKRGKVRLNEREQKRVNLFLQSLNKKR